MPNRELGPVSEQELQRRIIVATAANNLFSGLFTQLKDSEGQTLFLTNSDKSRALGLKSQRLHDNSRARRLFGVPRPPVDVIDFGKRKMSHGRVAGSILKPEGCLYRTLSESGLPEVGIAPCLQSRDVPYVPEAARAILLWELDGVGTDGEDGIRTSEPKRGPDHSDTLGTLDMVDSLAEASARASRLEPLRINAAL